MKNIQLVLQGDRPCCVQACCAMLTGVPLETVCKEFGHSHASYTREAVKFLRDHGVKCGDRLIKKSGRNEFPPLCIIKLHQGKRRDGHAVVYQNGLIFDPTNGKMTLGAYELKRYSQAGEVRFTSFLPIEVEQPGEGE